MKNPATVWDSLSWGHLYGEKGGPRSRLGRTLAIQAQSSVHPTAPAKRLLNRDVLTSAALGFVAGFVDAAGFIALSGLFTSHVTGNFVLIGAELVTTSGGVLAKLLALPAFVFGVAATRLIALGLERRNIAPLRPLLTLQAGLLIAFLATGVAISPLGSPDAVGSIFAGMLGVAAMSVQNAVARLSLPHLAATTVMTVNVTQTVIDAVDLCRDSRSKTAEHAATRLRRMVPAVLAFGIGALAGAFGVAAWSFWCLLAPIIILVGLGAGIGSSGQGENSN